MVEGPTRWGIVGGGMLGMELARQLARARGVVTVFEAASEPGGLAMTWEIAGTRWDKHYHVILPTDTRLVALLDELGLGGDIAWEKSSTGLFAGGKLYSVSSTSEFLRLPSLRLIDKFRLGVTMLYASRVNDWERLEKISAEKWLSRWSGARAYREFWRPLLRSKLGGNADLASAAFIWAIMKRLYRARTSGAKVEKLGFVRGGYAQVLDALVAAIADAGVELRTSAPVEQVKANSDGRVTVTESNGTQHEFDRVVVTTAAPLIGRIVEGLTATERARLDGIVYQGIVCASLVFDRPLGGFYVTNITDDGFPFTGVIEMSALTGTEIFGGKHLVFLPRYTTADDEAWSWSDDEAVARFTSGLQRMYPDLAPDAIVEAKVSRVRNVLAVSTINHSQSIPPLWTSVPGVAIVSSAQILHGTLNVDETLGVIEAALPGLLGDKGTTDD
ncbi:MAG: NAD(P)/FAD-dependent oxidoreductase [Acidimicrobiia bacterium]